MTICDMLKKSYFVIMLTKYLDIIDIQNVLITFNLKDHIDLFFMRECLSLMHLENEKLKELQETTNNVTEQRKEHEQLTDVYIQKRKAQQEDIHPLSNYNNYFYRRDELVEKQSNPYISKNEKKTKRCIAVEEVYTHVYENKHSVSEETKSCSSLENSAFMYNAESFSFETDSINNIDDDCDMEWRNSYYDDICNETNNKLHQTQQENRNNVSKLLNNTMAIEGENENRLMNMHLSVDPIEDTIEIIDVDSVDRTRKNNTCFENCIENDKNQKYCMSMNKYSCNSFEEEKQINDQQKISDIQDVLSLKILDPSLININTEKWEKLKKYLCDKDTLTDMNTTTNDISKEKKVAKNLFADIWTYIHVSNGAIDVQQGFNNFFEMDVSVKVKKNYKNIKYDMFQIFMYKNKYYCFFDLPWRQIYFNLNLNSICVNCEEKILDMSNCIKGEDIPLYQANRILLDYYMNLTDMKKNETDSLRNWEGGDILENTDKLELALTDINSEHTCKKKRKRDEKKNDKSNNEIEAIMEKNKMKKKKVTEGNKKFDLIKMTHVLCEKCLEILEYKHVNNDLMESIKEDMCIAREYGLLKEAPEPKFHGISLVCNYFILKVDFSDFILKSAIVLKDGVEKLRNRYQNILMLSYSYYDSIIKLVLSCNDERVKNSDNIFIYAFYLKHKKILQLFYSPRIAFVKQCFLILEKKLPIFLAYFNCTYFLKLSKRLTRDINTLLIKKYSISKKDELYGVASTHLYNYLDQQMLQKRNFKYAYTYFTNIIIDWIKNLHV